MRGIFFDMNIDILKTNSANPHFQSLVRELDYYLAIIDGEEHSFYAQYNKISDINNCIVLFCDGVAVSCGAYKVYDEKTVEIKRMFTKEDYRGQGFAQMILTLLEKWAREEGYIFTILETGNRQESAVNLYNKSGYEVIENYGHYKNVENSICFRKELFI